MIQICDLIQDNFFRFFLEIMRYNIFWHFTTNQNSEVYSDKCFRENK